MLSREARHKRLQLLIHFICPEMANTQRQKVAMRLSEEMRGGC